MAFMHIKRKLGTQGIPQQQQIQCLTFSLMTKTNRNYGFYAYQTKARNPGNTAVATKPVFDHIMTSNDLIDLQKLKFFNHGFVHVN